MKHASVAILSFLMFVVLIEPAHPSPTFNAIFSFGDSYTDTGNLNALGKILNIPVNTDNLPYGETFFHRPSHRCSDGRLIVDFLAEEFGLPLLPPFWEKSGNYRQGANFAVAGATCLDQTFFKEHNITTLGRPLDTSLNFQLQWFEELKPWLCQTPQDCCNYFGKSLFIVGEIGGNDYLDIFFTGMNMTQLEYYASIIVRTITMTIKRLIDHGARTLVVPGNIPMGCIPTVLTIFKNQRYSSYEHRTGCLKRYNRISRHHNTLIREAIKELRVQYPYAKFIYADYYKAVTNLVKFPTLYGFTSTPLVACCGKGGEYNVNTTEFCGTPEVNACPNPLTSVNWDGVHLTEAAYRHISDGWLKGPYAHPPILDVNNK